MTTVEGDRMSIELVDRTGRWLRYLPRPRVGRHQVCFVFLFNTFEARNGRLKDSASAISKGAICTTKILAAMVATYGPDPPRQVLSKQAGSPDGKSDSAGRAKP